MITINLKPGSKRAAAGASLAGGMNALKSMRARVKDPWPMGAVAVVSIVAIGLLAIGLGSASRVSSLEDQLATARAENRRFKTFLVEKRRAEAAKDSIVLQIATIRSVDGDRYVWPHILDEVTRALPAYTWLTDVSALPQAAPLDSTSIAPPAVSLQILGRTMDIQGFTRFMRQLEDSPWLRDVTVVTTTTEIDHGRAVTAFTLRTGYDRPAHGRTPAAPAGER
ncbi:MAG TPA: PilN domain-containing protein [Gemmatimonadales bacterium]|nr:PilN domain-containing protein [Gemmatimonadales bacterium]